MLEFARLFVLVIPVHVVSLVERGESSEYWKNDNLYELSTARNWIL